jgi:hypothetical protein
MAFEVGPLEMPIAPEVQRALDLAYREAASLDHDAVTVEHVALALLSDPEIAAQLERGGARLESVEGLLEEQLAARPRSPLVLGERPLTPPLAHALRASAHSTLPWDTATLLALLFEQSPALSALTAAGASPANLRESAARGRGAALPSAYRSAMTPRSWTLHVADGGHASEPLLGSLARSLGLSRFGATRAIEGVRRPEGIDVGLFAEADARRLAASAEREARASLRIEPRTCASAEAQALVRTRVVRWWRAVRALQLTAVLGLSAGAALFAWLVRNDSDATMEHAVSVSAGRHVSVKARAMTDHPRFLLREGPLFAADPRQPPVEHYTPFDYGLSRSTDKRVSIQSLQSAPSAHLSFDADRDIPTARGARRTHATWLAITCNNCTDDVLVVGVAPVLQVPLVGTLRELASAGRSPDDLRAIHRAKGGKKLLRWVVDVDPLPPGPVERWIPICEDNGVLDVACTPKLWTLADEAHPLTTHDQVTVLEGSVAASSDRRLRVGPSPSRLSLDADARVLVRGDAPAAYAMGAAAALALLGGLLAGVAHFARARRRPARAT